MIESGGLLVGVRMDLFPVQSSMIAAAGYDARMRVMVILYNTGRAYEYHEVPPEIFWGLMSAESKGQFMNRYVLGIFPYKVFHGWERIEEEELQESRWGDGSRSRIRRGSY